MPTIFLLDVSLSMAIPIASPDSSEMYQLKHLAIHGLNHLLDFISVNAKLEFISLMTFSSQCKKLVTFTRESEQIKTALNKIELFDSSFLMNALEYVKIYVLDEWGGGLPCQVILVTDGSIGIGPNSLRSKIDQPGQTTLPFPFPCKLHVVSLLPPDDITLYHKLLELNGSEGQLWILDGPVTFKSVQQIFQKIADAYYKPFNAQLLCGHLNSYVTLCPPPEPYIKANDFDWVHAEMANSITICGFLNLSDVASPPTLSRHLVLPIFQGKDENAVSQVSSDLEDDLGGSEEGKQPSFCVLLHGSLKVGGMVAFCHLGGEWYGILYSWADSKKKSNLMLSTFEPGLNSVPWLGNFTNLGSKMDNQLTESSFPVKPSEKRSYAQNCVVWIRQPGLQADIQKILRHARKLPDKMPNFYKELNRLRKACLSFGFYNLLEGMATILERECTHLPGSAHPDAAIQLSHAATLLRSESCKDYDVQLGPLNTKFRSE